MGGNKKGNGKGGKGNPPLAFDEGYYWRFVASVYTAGGFLLLLPRLGPQNTFLIKYSQAALQAISSSSIDIASLLVALLSIFIVFNQNVENTTWFCLALFFDTLAFLGAAAKGYFAYMTEPLELWFRTEWNVILGVVVLVILLCLAMSRPPRTRNFTFIHRRIEVPDSVVRYFKVLAFAVPYILLMLYLIISEPMIIGTYFLGGLLGLIILLCMLIWASGLRESILWGDQAGGDQGERADMELRESWERYNQSLRISVRGRTVTRAKIINVFNDFDSQYPDTRDYDDWLNKTKYHSAVRYTGKLYPPKKILSMAANIPLRRAPVGEEANQVFRELGFDIVNK